jgi:flagellar hook-associated protein 2
MATSTTGISILSVGTNAQGLPTLGNTLSGGIDVTSAVNGAMGALEIPEQLLQQQQTTLQSQVSALNQVSTDLSSLLTSVQALTDPAGSLNSMSTTSSDSTVVTADATSGSQPGNHTVVVNSLATTSSYYSTNELTNASTTFTPGSITLQVGGNTPVTIPPTGTDNTLAGLVSDINNSNAGVTASVVTDSGGSRLALVSNSSGLAGNITVTANTTGLTLANPVTGQNASLVVDGIPVASASNTVTSIPGLTLNLQNANPKETVSIGVAADTDAASTAIQGFVTAYNTVIADINAQTATGSGSTAVLQGDPTMRDIQQRVLTDITASVLGNGSVSNLDSIGIAMNDDGTLTVNSSTLNNALSSNFTQVQNLFQNATGVGATFANDLTNLTDPTEGEIALTVQGDNNTITSLGQSISDDQVSLSAQQTALEAQYNLINTTLEEIPSLEAQTASQLQGA